MKTLTLTLKDWLPKTPIGQNWIGIELFRLPLCLDKILWAYNYVWTELNGAVGTEFCLATVGLDRNVGLENLVSLGQFCTGYSQVGKLFDGATVRFSTILSGHSQDAS